MTSAKDALIAAGLDLSKLAGGTAKNESEPTKENAVFVLNSGERNSKVIKNG